MFGAVEVGRQDAAAVPEAVLLSGRPARRRAPPSSPRRTARSSPLGSRSRGSSSENGAGANFGYAHTVPATTTLPTSWTRESSRTCAPIIRFAYQYRPRIGAVRADPADLGRQVEDELGPRLGEEPLRALPRRQVVLVAARDERLLPALLQALDQMGADEPAASGDEDSARPQVSRTGPVASPSVQRLPTPVAALGLVIAAVAVVGWWGAIAVGPAAGPDAAEHIRYAEYFDTTGHLPPESENYEYASPPAYQVAAVYLQRAARTLSIGDGALLPFLPAPVPPGGLARAARSPPPRPLLSFRVAAHADRRSRCRGSPAHRGPRRGVRPRSRRPVVVRPADLARLALRPRGRHAPSPVRRCRADATCPCSRPE